MNVRGLLDVEHCADGDASDTPPPSCYVKQMAQRRRGIVGNLRTSPTSYDRFDERPRINHPFRLFSRNCRAFRFDCFLISNSTFLSTIARSIDVQSTSFSNLSGHFIVSFITLIKISLIFFFFYFFFIACTMYYALSYNVLIIVINIVSYEFKCFSRIKIST